MRKLFFIVGFFLAGCGGGGGGTPAATNGATGAATDAVASVSKFAWDVAGAWKVVSQNCAGVIFVGGIVSVGSTVNTVQHFTTDGGFEGLGDTEDGDFFLCYDGTVSVCNLGCIGIMDKNYKSQLLCDDPAGGLCDLVYQKS